MRELPPGEGVGTKAPGGQQYSLSSPLMPYFKLVAMLSGIRRRARNVAIASQLPEKVAAPYPDRGFSVLGGHSKPNGLNRAYRYELRRLESQGLLNHASRNVLILGQPRHYGRLLRRASTDLEGRYRIGLWVTEFDVMPPDWGFAMNIVNEVWTPSHFSACALAACGLPITVVPHAVSVQSTTPLPRSRFGIPADAFLGLAIMDLGTCPDRKNPLAHIAAWRQGFGSDSRAVLLLKARFGSGTRFARRAVKSAVAGLGNVILLEEEFTDGEISRLQAMADVYLSLHRSEGYGLNIHECLELGVPVVATGYSGNMTFMSRYPNAIPLPYRLVPYRDPTFHYSGDGLRWAEPCVESAARILQDLRGRCGSSLQSVRPAGAAA